jgi:1-acyl-sn-glycerol-3-phosphate acyltransferase
MGETSPFDVPFEQRPFVIRWIYFAFRSVLMAAMIVVCGVRATGRHRSPMKGKALLLANHASYYDVVVLGITQPRNIDFMARSGLFVPGLGWLIRTLGGFAIQRGGGGASGIKETLRRLRYESMVGMFPEGTRTSDGQLLPIKTGVMNLARKSGSTIGIAGIAGTFEAWPRQRPFPGSYPVAVVYADPISPDELTDKTEEEAVALLEHRLSNAFTEAREINARIRDIMMF